jgi:GT2 family glycosyltransferase
MAAREAHLSAHSQSPEVSIVVISHNGGSALKETVDAFLGTVPPTAEVIVVDDCSADGSTDFMDTGYFGVVPIRAERRLGVAAARNRGARAATGRVLVFADAHVGVAPGWLAPLVDALRPPQIAAAGPAIGAIDDDLIGIGYGMEWVDDSLRVGWLDRRGTQPYAVPLLAGGFLAVNGKRFRAAGGFDDGFRSWGSEDVELCYRFWSLGYECRVVPEVAVGHRFRSSFAYPVDEADILHNLLRLGTVHFLARWPTCSCKTQ